MINKERTLQGVYDGRVLALGMLPSGDSQQVTIWDDILVLGRSKQSPLIRQYRGRYLVGGRWWREIPQGMTAQHKNIYLYPDTLANAITWLIRPWLIPGREPGRRLYNKVKLWLNQ